MGSSLKTQIQKIRENYKKYGLWVLVLHLLLRIGIIIKREYIFFELKLEDVLPHKKTKNNSHLKFIRVNKKKFKNYTFPDIDGWLTENEALKRLADENNILLALTEGNKIVCYIWCEFNRAHIAILDLLVSIPDNWVYIKDLYTAPEFRGKGLASKLRLLEQQFLKKSGYQRVFNVVRPNNIASQKIMKKCGMKEYQIVIYRKFFFLRYYRVKDYDTDNRKRFLYIKGIDQKLWKQFSKIK